MIKKRYLSYKSFTNISIVIIDYTIGTFKRGHRLIHSDPYIIMLLLRFCHSHLSWIKDPKGNWQPFN